MNPVVNGLTNRRTLLAGAAGLGADLLLGRSSLARATRPDADPALLQRLPSSLLFAGDASTAYRDPAAIYVDGWFHLFFTLIRQENSTFYAYVASTRSRDLRHWTPVRTLTPRDKSLEYSSPGDVVHDGKDWVLCLQTYPRPHGERYGTRDARLWTMRSRDLETWSTPELLRVKGPGVSAGDMGRMIDPFLLRDKADPAKWWCFYKQNGISLSTSPDLRTWTYVARTDAGENPCVVVDREEYVLFHSPPNGVGVKRSTDLLHWQDEDVFTLGQPQWPWAQGRLTGAFVLDLRQQSGVGKALLFFHGSRFGEDDPRGGFDNFASLGLAWSSDLHGWQWK